MSEPLDIGHSDKANATGINEKNSSSTGESVSDFIGDFIKDVSVPNLLLGALVGAAAGAALSFVNQTLVNPPKDLILPTDKFEKNKIDFLKTRAPDLLYAINDFYSFRRFVDKDQSLAMFDYQAGILIDRTIDIVAVYNKIHALREKYGFNDQFMQEYTVLLTQARKDLALVTAAMRCMPKLLTNSKMIEIKHAFNYLYSLYQDRFMVLWQIASGIRE